MKEQVLAVAKKLLATGLVEGTAGNISARLDDGSICITPSSVAYDAMALDDLVTIDLDGTVLAGRHHPSSERLLHLACYRAFPEVRSVIHAHPVYATMFAVARRPIPACIDEFSLYVGGDVPVTEYAVSGSEALGERAVAVLAERGAALLANHGMVAVGPSPDRVLHITALVERGAQVVWGARALGTIHRLPDQASGDLAQSYRIQRAGASPWHPL